MSRGSLLGPYKREVVEAIQKASQTADPEAIKAQVKQELMFELKERELANKERLTDAQIRKLMADAVQAGVTSAFAAMQAGEKIAMNPLIAPIGDVVIQNAGWQPPNPAGVDPNYPVPPTTTEVNSPGGLPGDTSPTTPQSPSQGASQGIETLRQD